MDDQLKYLKLITQLTGQKIGNQHEQCSAGLLISNIDIDIDSIDDTFGVSISVSTILLGRGIESSIDDTFKAVFFRYFDIDTFELMLIKFQRISSLKVNYRKQNQYYLLITS